jgi:predicted  nucleic acid-binding Zn-ribbon protein
MSQPFKLFRLQQIDSQLDQDRRRLTEIEAILSNNDALDQAQGSEKQAVEAGDRARKGLRKAEEAVQAQRVKIEQTNATLYGGKVRNPKELQDLQNEIGALKRYLSILEDRQLEAMLELEEVEKQEAAASAELEKVQKEVKALHANMIQEQAALTQNVRNSEVERQAAVSAIPQEDLSLYEQLRRQRRGVAVARVTDKACSACGTILNFALLHAARSPNQLTRCDSCGRILYSG